MYNRNLILALIPFPLILAAADGDQIAFLKNSHVFISSLDGQSVRQLDHDARPKYALIWDLTGKRLAYLVASQQGEKARLVVMDLVGKQLAEVAIRPITDPPTGGMRFAEKISWTSDGKFRVAGSVNPSNCEMFDFDISTGNESNGQLGKCWSFAPSPDGKHIAELGLVQQFTDEEHRFDVVDLDSIGLFAPHLYAGGDHDVFIPAGPAWSPDSQHLAILEKRAATGEAAVVILSLDRVATRIPVPLSALEGPEIEWVGTKIVVGQGANAIQVDPATRGVSGLTSDIANEIKRRTAAQSTGDVAGKHVDDIVRQLGGKAGVLLQGEVR